MDKPLGEPNGSSSRAMSDQSANFYKPPQVDLILRHPLLTEWRKNFDSKVLTLVVRCAIEDKRKDLKENPVSETKPFDDPDHIAGLAVKLLHRIVYGGLKSVINGTGIIINTNLGRAPLPAETCDYICQILSGYCNLEADLETGQRGERNSQIDLLLRLITGCQSAIVVNNNAAAVMLAVATLACGKEVIVSRGELVEIGGSFRLPEVIEQAGGRLKEVGTTNKTRLSDYKNAINHTTGMILKCHQSNFQMRGFVEAVSVTDLVSLGQEENIAVVEDLGSGSLFPLQKLSIPAERTVQMSTSDGANLTLFSGDKLLGGSQAGFIIGNKKLVAELHANPIYRALRPDKLVIAIIESVLKLYLQSDAEDRVPVLAMGKEDQSSIEHRVQDFVLLAETACPSFQFEPIKTDSAFGGGTSPELTLPSCALSMQSKGKLVKASQLAHILRTADPPVIARVSNNRVLIDFRTVTLASEPALLKAMSQLERTCASMEEREH